MSEREKQRRALNKALRELIEHCAISFGASSPETMQEIPQPVWSGKHIPFEKLGLCVEISEPQLVQIWFEYQQAIAQQAFSAPVCRTLFLGVVFQALLLGRQFPTQAGNLHQS